MIAIEKRYFKTQACREILSAVLSFPYENTDDKSYTAFIEKILSSWTKKSTYGAIKSAILEIEPEGNLFWILNEKGIVRKIKNDKSTTQTIADAGTGPNKYGYLSMMKKIENRYFVAGFCNQVYENINNEWVHIDENILTDDDDLEYDIQDIIGRNGILCAVGNEGQICIRKDDEWLKYDCGTEEHFYAVCLDDKGDFWASGSNGIVIRGNGVEFEIICEENPDLGSFWDIEFYNDEIVVSGSMGLFVVRNNELVPFDKPNYPAHSAFKLVNANGRFWSLGDNKNYCLHNGIWEEWEFSKA